MTTPKTEDLEETRLREEWGHALERLSDEDERLLSLLRLMGEVLDPRYEMKGIRALVGRSLVDPPFRSRVLDDADAVLDELRGHVELPENTRVRCVENSTEYLTVLLPPPATYLNERSRSVRDFIFSRTSPDLAEISSGVDDNDILPLFIDGDTGGGGHPQDSSHWGDTSHDG